MLKTEVYHQGFPRKIAHVSDCVSLLLWCHWVDGARDSRDSVGFPPLNTDKRNNIQELHILIASSLKQCECERFVGMGRVSTLRKLLGYYA